MTTTADSGSGSLRWAIGEANSAGGNSTIHIKVAGTISVGSQTSGSWYPDITTGMTIDGTQAPGYSPNQPPVVVIDGTQVTGNNQDAFDVVVASGTVIKGLEIRNFGHYGIYVHASSACKIQGNFIHSNGYDGIGIGGGTNNLVGGDQPGERNVISGNEHRGIGFYAQGFQHKVQGNYIGTDLAGQAALPNGWGGIAISGGTSQSVIGGDVPAMRNVISGNTFSGVGIWDPGSNQNKVFGNYIGTDRSGLAPLPNEEGVVITGGASQTEIGGALLGRRNVISGNTTAGVSIHGNGTKSNIVTNNIIGLNRFGTHDSAVPNGSGVMLSSSSASNQILTNLISGNSGDGIGVWGNSVSNMIAGNFIGTDAFGSVKAANQWSGISISSSPNSIFDNVISGNNGSGVAVFAPAKSLQIMGNKIGTDSDGNEKVPNATGLFIADSADHLITDNLISGNLGDGIHITGASASYVSIATNRVGTTDDGLGELGNGGNGITVRAGAHHALIGADGANIIAGNEGVGVRIEWANSNTLAGNLIGRKADNSASLWNQGGGVAVVDAAFNYVGDSGKSNQIDAGLLPGVLVIRGQSNGIFENTFVQTNTDVNPIMLMEGGNTQLAAPTLLSCTSSGSTVIGGKLENVLPFTAYKLQFYTNQSPFSSGGGVYEGWIQLEPTDLTGVVNFAVNFQLGLSDGDLIYATATDPNQNTSAFGVPCEVEAKVSGPLIATSITVFPMPLPIPPGPHPVPSTLLPTKVAGQGNSSAEPRSLVIASMRRIPTNDSESPESILLLDWPEWYVLPMA